MNNFVGGGFLSVGRIVQLVDDFQNFGFAEPSGVMGLAAGGRVEGGTIEDDLPAISIALTGDHAGFELFLKRIVIVEPVGHGNFPRFIGPLPRIPRAARPVTGWLPDLR